MSVRTYNPSVRVGNWNEDIQLEEDTLKEFLHKRESGQLLNQKRTKLEQTIFKKTDLSISRDGFVHFGDKVNIRCPAALDRTQYFAHIEPRSECNLAVVPQVNKILYSSKFEAPCNVTGSRDLTPNLRSTFVVKSKDGTKDGEPLRYGQVFYLSTLDDEGGNLFLQSDRVTLHKSPNKSRHQELSLVCEVSPKIEWKILHLKPKLRLEYEGIPVTANDKIIFNHVVTNQDLCVEQDICIRTSFGTREYEMSACTMLDSHRAEKEQNHWMFVMGVPGDEVCPVTSQSVGTASTSATS
ncbi:cilia- and flagella-associated protein 161-like [Mercenaria mercenaria]|uniref:cilia- and flagella-associated protein 161-like n=1 Tax=Mercenaria mercenaria TaxID=6596 RepID=UPI001E1DF0E3|nr:cilia- and flagella-associated protein 161-like [Mercenaria mercenaria]